MSHNKNKKMDEKKDLKNLSEEERSGDIICECEDCQNIIEKLKKENTENELAYKRALADYQNLAKHSSSEKVEFFKYSLEKFFLEILPIFDNLKMAISTLGEKEQENPWVEGIKYVIKQFRDTFSENGVEEIKTVGEKFDYNKMEAIKGDGEIVKKEIRPGYILNGKVIIPAKVVLFFKDDPENNIK